MTSRKKYDDIRAEFISGKMTLRDLADKHGVAYDALRKAAARGEWMDERHRLSQKVTSEVINTNIQTRVAELSQFNADDLRMAKALRGMAAQLINQSQQANAKKLTIGELGQIARLTADAQKIGRLALGASTDNHELTGAGQGPIQVSDVPLDEYKAALKQVLDEY
jgi:hypothetical protein